MNRKMMEKYLDVSSRLLELKDFIQYKADDIDVNILDKMIAEAEDILEIGLCPVCGAYEKKKETVPSRFDIDVDICLQCRIDGS